MEEYKEYTVLNKSTGVYEYTYCMKRKKNIKNKYPESTHCHFEVPEGKNKEAYSWNGSEIEEDESYDDSPTMVQMIGNEKYRYREREDQGRNYSRIMDARLIILGKALGGGTLSKTVRNILDEMFDAARSHVHKGRWVSAKNEIDKVVISAELETIITTNGLDELIDQAGLIQEVKDRIDIAIESLYD